MERIYLGWHGREITITDEGYKALISFLAPYRVCAQQGCTYTAENPMVGKNLCLACLLRRQQYLTFQGQVGEPDEQGYCTFLFLDQQEHVYLSDTYRSEEATRSIVKTLEYHGFACPLVYTSPRGGEVKLYPNGWNIYGDVRRSVVIISIRYDAKHDVAFLSYKGGTYRELTKRDLEMKTLLQRATEIIEQTKDSDGFYHAGDYPTRYLNDSVLYDVIAEMEAAVYDIRQKFQRNKPAQAQPAESEVMPRNRQAREQ